MTMKAEYELLEEIGRGACGTVYRAHDMALKRDVAVKELSEPLRKDPRQLRRLLDGARFLAGFSHDHLVQVHGLDEGRGWIIMELMRGGLDSRAAEGPLPADLTRSVLRQALEGLQFLHRQGKLHGAIKPANLLINAEGRVKLSDAVCLDAQGEMRKPSDDAKYLAPELIDPSFGEVGPGTDLYCLGLTALELLKGPSFDAFFQGAGAANPQMTWLRLHGSPSEQLPSARVLVPGVPADLCRVIDRLLAKKVSERYSSAAEALKDLEEGELLRVDIGTAARPVPAPRPTTQSVPSNGSPSPRPAPPALPEPPRKSSPLSPSGPPGPAFKPWSKDWLNHKLSDKRVLYPLLGVMIVGTLVFFFWPEAEPTPSRKVRVASTPEGATVIIDGQKQEQVTEATLRLAPGKHHLRLELAGHEPAEEDFEVQAEGPAVKLHKILRAEMAQSPPSGDAEQEKKDGKKETPPKQPSPPSLPQSRRVHLASTPPQADIVVDGKREGRTDSDIELKVGSHRVKLVKAGYELREEDIEVKAEGPSPSYSWDLTAVVRTPPKRIASSIGMDLVLIPAGKCMMGSATHEMGAASNEDPRHEITLSRPFYMGACEVTQEQYEKVMGQNPAVFTREEGGGPQHPVENVSWDDARAFCRKLSQMPEEKRAGRSYRLPTEAEWEYACRAGTKTPFHTGNSLSASQACFQGSKPGGDAGKEVRSTAPVGSYPANAWGLHDMHGNVREWCADWYSGDAYFRSAEQDPQGPRTGTQRVVRGGSWQSPRSDCRSARRLMMSPDLVNVGTGFRVVMVLSGQE